MCEELVGGGWGGVGGGGVERVERNLLWFCLLFTHTYTYTQGYEWVCVGQSQGEGNTEGMGGLGYYLPVVLSLKPARREGISCSSGLPNCLGNKDRSN